MTNLKTALGGSLPIFLTLLSVVHTEEVYVRVGDMVALHCPNIRIGNTETFPSWTSFMPHKRDISNDMNTTSSFLIHERSLVLLNASVDHQGNYSCSVGNHTFWFKLVVYSAMSNDEQMRALYTASCNIQERCTLRCPISNSPRPNIPNMTPLGITWRKDGNSSQFRDTLFFSSVEETDQQTFTCTRSYLYKGQMYNMTFSIALTVKPQEPLPNVEIISPQDGDVFQVDLGSVFVVNCTATLFSDFDEIYWIIDKSSAKTDPNLRVFSNNTIVTRGKETHMTALLIFKEVLEQDLSKDFICKLESVAVASSLVTVSLEKKSDKFGRKKRIDLVCLFVLFFSTKYHEKSKFLSVIIVAIILLTAVTVLICLKFKMDIFLCLRDRLLFCTKSVDTKPYDASLVCYKSESQRAFTEDDTKWFKNVLEKDLEYKLCLPHSSLSGEERSGLDRIEQSHAVILVPVVSNPGADLGFITKDCSSMDTSSTCIILIQTETEKESKSSRELKLQEAAPLLGHFEQRIVTWKGTTSKKQSSSFIKHLRYYLPPPRRKQEQPIPEA